MRMSYDKLVEGVKDIQAKLDVLKPEDPKRSDLEKQLNAALLATTRAQLEIFEYREKREKKSLDESKKLRAQILREIMEGVKQLGADRGFHVIFPEKLPEENAPLWVFPTDRAEDVTDALLKLLNERYAAKQTRGAK